MNRKTPCRATALALVTVLLIAASPAHAEKQAVDLFPPKAMAYIEVRHPAALVRDVENHPFYRRLVEHTGPGGLPALLGVGREFDEFKATAEAKFAKPWAQAYEAATAGGIYVLFENPTRPQFLVKSADAQSARKFAESLLAFVGAKTGSAFRQTEYRGLKVFAGPGDDSDKLVIAAIDNWVVFCHGEAAKNVLDNFVDEKGATLAAQPNVAVALKAASPDANVWAFVQLDTLRSGLEGLLTTNVLLVETGAGGLLAALRGADSLWFEATSASNSLKLSVHVPWDIKAAASSRAYYFGADGRGAAAATIAPAGTVLSVSVYRDLGELWAAMPKLLDNDLTRSLPLMDDLFIGYLGGHRFSELLKGLGPQTQVVVANTKVSDARRAASQLPLPGVAVVLSLRDKQDAQAMLTNLYTTVMALANSQFTIYGTPLMRVEKGQMGKGTFISAAVPEDALKAVKEPSVLYGISPTLAFVGDHAIIASTREMAELMLAEVASPETKPGVVNTRITLQGKGLVEALTEHRQAVEQLVGINQDGLREATDLMTTVERISLSLTPGEATLKLEIELTTKD